MKKLAIAMDSELCSLLNLAVDVGYGTDSSSKPIHQHLNRLNEGHSPIFCVLLGF